MKKSVFFLMVLVFAAFPSGREQALHRNTMSTDIDSVSVRLVNNLLEEVNPTSDQSSWVPPFAHQKLLWFYHEVSARRMRLTSFGTEVAVGKPITAMESGVNQKGELTVEIRSRVILALSRSVDRQTLLDTFVLMLTHEVVHHEKAGQFGHAHSLRENIAEEARVWYAVDTGVVRPFLNRGLPVDTNYVRADEILKACSYRQECPEFRKFIANRGLPK